MPCLEDMIQRLIPSVSAVRRWKGSSRTAFSDGLGGVEKLRGDDQRMKRLARSPGRLPCIGVGLALTLMTGVVSPKAEASQEPQDGSRMAKATFAGGCFWCVEEAFDKVAGVVSTTSGYTGGHKLNPSYEEVSSGGTGHVEAVRVLYDPTKTSYEKLLEAFWINIDPTTPNRQFCDKGEQYRAAIFYHDESQKRLAEESKQALEQSKRFKGAIVTEIAPASDFYVAEKYHQDYYQKNPARYKFYKYSCGRSQRLEKLWGKKA
jgi:peptide-methionine (S)-S-oxide reductase